MSENISKKPDWRERARKHPGVIGIGALTIGFVVGYSLIKVINRGSNGAVYSQDDYETKEAKAHSKRVLQQRTKSNNPSWLDKLKSIRAFDRLRDETNNLMNQFVDEAVKIGKTVLIPVAVEKISRTITSSLDSPELESHTTGQQKEAEKSNAVYEQKAG